MAINVVVPSVGESISEGTVANWFKKDGDLVRADEPLFELETEKATTEVPAPAAGVLRITVPEGKTVAIGSVIGRIEEDSKAGKAPPVVKDGDGAVKPAQVGRKPVTSPPEEKSLRVCAYFKPELLLMLTQAGFRDVTVHGAYTEKEATADDGVLVFTAKK